MPEEITALFKTALARWPSGVTVIAAEVDGEKRGMTASSFSSVSLEPPLILVCVDEKAHMMGLLERASHFTVNILAEEQKNESSHFSGKPGPFDPLQPDLSIEDALATLYCSRWQIYPGGDHWIVVGKVEKVRLGDGQSPLLYWNRGYHRLV